MMEYPNSNQGTTHDTLSTSLIIAIKLCIEPWDEFAEF